MLASITRLPSSAHVSLPESATPTAVYGKGQPPCLSLLQETVHRWSGNPLSIAGTCKDVLALGSLWCISVLLGYRMCGTSQGRPGHPHTPESSGMQFECAAVSNAAWCIRLHRPLQRTLKTIVRKCCSCLDDEVLNSANSRGKMLIFSSDTSV